MVGEAATALTPAGLFTDVGPPPERAGEMISREVAREQAMAYVRAYAQFLEAAWERESGRDIHVPSLQADPRVYFVETPYGRFPEGPFHPAFRKGFGPEYLVTLTDGRKPVLLVGVSAFNTDVAIDERGLVVLPATGGNEFTTFAVPVDTQRYVPLSPEHAVERVARGTGARVTRVPEPVQMSAFHHVAVSVWRLPLDREVRVRPVDGSGQRAVRELYVNGLGHYLTPADEQPRGYTQDFPIGPPWDPRERQTREATVPLSAGQAIEWVRVATPGGA